jgi:hypothetical protein
MEIAKPILACVAAPLRFGTLCSAFLQSRQLSFIHIFCSILVTLLVTEYLELLKRNSGVVVV